MTAKVSKMSFASLYPLYVSKVEKKGITKAQLDPLIEWLTGYDAPGLEAAVGDKRSLETFLHKRPPRTPNEI